MSNIKQMTQRGCLFFVIYIVLLCIFPRKVFILTGMAALIFHLIFFFSRKGFLNTAINTMEEIKKKSESFLGINKDEAIALAYKPFMNLFFFALLGLLFNLQGLFYESGLICLIYLLFSQIRSGFQKRRINKEEMPDFIIEFVDQEDWDELSDETKSSMWSFKTITSPARFYFATAFNILFTAAVLYNEIVLHIDTWAWIGF